MCIINNAQEIGVTDSEKNKKTFTSAENKFEKTKIKIKTKKDTQLLIVHPDKYLT